ncbi:hypothetical protein N7E81_10950 [Reichenbachiella carrageenanivorans]|uniref:Uncharacterized protein n=1 Tax=Reichenbachiella carrageenanivorans TaxID=2979869 RepID=A0ABY6D220_9BACT|nr:hypothetical protein [Reichenbachiella carrageenanivorans]UXX77885.1 hypothetical protein N7E81_10950 [Reichenbachiella carrageenanivorans]
MNNPSWVKEYAHYDEFTEKLKQSEGSELIFTRNKLKGNRVFDVSCVMEDEKRTWFFKISDSNEMVDSLSITSLIGRSEQVGRVEIDYNTETGNFIGYISAKDPIIDSMTVTYYHYYIRVNTDSIYYSRSEDVHALDEGGQ